jgi:hypothetical protein
MVPLFAALLGLVLFAQVPNAVQSIGISLVSNGLIALSIDRIRSRIDWRLAAAVASAGMAVAGYSVIDAYGTRLNGDWIGFTAWLVIADTLTFLAVAASLRGKALWLELATMKLRIVGSGLLGVASFSVLGVEPKSSWDRCRFERGESPLFGAFWSHLARRALVCSSCLGSITDLLRTTSRDAVKLALTCLVPDRR